MKPETLYENLNSVDEQLLERSETAKAPRRRPWWMGAVAAALVAVVALGAAFWPKGSPLGVEAHAIETAVYPEMAPYPDEADYVDQATGEYDNEGFNQAHDAWWESKQALLPEEGYADGLDSFFQESIPVFLGGKEGENAAYSPVNVYMALAMLAELTDGASRQQILDLLGSDSLEALRQQAQAVWRAQYQNDGATTTILASSVWLDEDISYNQETMQTLAESYYASSYQGQMGSEEYSQLLREWLNDQWSAGRAGGGRGAETGGRAGPGHHPVLQGPLGRRVLPREHQPPNLPRPQRRRGGGLHAPDPGGELLPGGELRRGAQRTAEQRRHVAHPA